MFRRLFTTETLPALPGGASLSGASAVYAGICLHSLLSPKVLSHPALPCLAPCFTYGHALWCRLESGGLQLLSLLCGQQVPQTCLTKSISGAKIGPLGAGSAHATRSLCTGWVWKVRSFATSAFHCVAPNAGRLCSAGGFACSAHTCPTR